MFLYFIYRMHDVLPKALKVVSSFGYDLQNHCCQIDKKSYNIRSIKATICTIIWHFVTLRLSCHNELHSRTQPSFSLRCFTWRWSLMLRSSQVAFMVLNVSMQNTNRLPVVPSCNKFCYTGFTKCLVWWIYGHPLYMHHELQFNCLINGYIGVP